MVSKTQSRSVESITNDIFLYGPTVALKKELSKARNRENARRSRKRRQNRIDRLMKENAALKKQVAELQEQLKNTTSVSVVSLPLTDLFSI